MINESPRNPRSQGICPYDAERLVPGVGRQSLRVIRKDNLESKMSFHSKFRNAMNKSYCNFKYFFYKFNFNNIITHEGDLYNYDYPHD